MFDHLAKRASVIMAHPDDAEIGCFGTMLKLIERGFELTLLIVGSGVHGVSVADRDRGQGQLEPSLRLKESLAAFEGTGVKVESLMFEDGSLSVDRALISEIERHLRAFEPSLLITHHLDLTGLDHQDHLAVAKSCINASARQRCVRMILHSEPHLSRTQFNPNVFVDITDHHEAKLTALSKHQSQAGRVYLSRAYHENRGMRHAHQAGTWFLEQERMFECFELTLSVLG